MRESGRLLHPEYFDWRGGADIASAITPALKSLKDLAIEQGSQEAVKHDMTVAVQLCNDSHTDMWDLYHDIEAQARDVHGDVQLLFVNGNTYDENNSVITNAIQGMRRWGSDHISQIRYAAINRDRLNRSTNFRADLLNTIVEKASANYIYTTVGHASLTNNLTLDEAVCALHKGEKDGVAAAYGISVPGKNASFFERAGARILGVNKLLREGSPKAVLDASAMGILAVESLAFRKDVVQELGGFPTEYGTGGMGEMARKLLDNGHGIAEITELAVHHTHGFGPVDSLHQLRAWQKTRQPADFIEQEWQWHPNRGL